MSDPFIGEIRMFGGNFAPMDWAFCNGQILNIAQNDALFSLIGTTYGGDGINNFALPDLRGRLPMHQGNNHVTGEKLGTETVTLTAAQMPAHTHTVSANKAAGDKDSPLNAVWAAKDPARYASGPADQGMKNTLVGNFGGGLSHENLMPYLAVNFIIALSGMYPQRS